MKITNENIAHMSREYGRSFYHLDIQQFEQNYDELYKAFNSIYPNTHISYSYKTNYIPKLCKSILDKNGYAEVVSSMECDIARKLNVPWDMIIYNGPWKDERIVEDILIHDGLVNIDSIHDFSKVIKIAKKHEHPIKIGIRINFDIGDGVISRFGFDPDEDDFIYILNYLKDVKTNIKLDGIHLHFASRNIDYWPSRAIKLIDLIEKYDLHLSYFSLGGGMFGKMDVSLKKQFDTKIPTYLEYANAVCPILLDYFTAKGDLPKLFIEPGSALVGDCMQFIAPVVSIKKIRGNTIATLLGSIYNINPTLNTKNPPLEIIHFDDNDNEIYNLQNVNFGGYTCIENDYLYKNYNGPLAVDDVVVFYNVGSYSVVLKPPFILPNFPILAIQDNKIEVIKKMEKFEDLFQTYIF